MKSISIIFLMTLVTIISSCAPQVPPAEITIMPLKTGWTHSEKTLHSWKALRDKNVVVQRFDYSCGASALATLMRYYFEDEVSEEEILTGILLPMIKEEVLDREEKGLSLLDLKRYAEQRGYQAMGVKLSYANLTKLKGPVLIHLERKDYKHFAVLKGVWGDRIYLADPSRGNIRIPVYRFAQEWSGVALILGREGFGLPQTYPLALVKEELSLMEMRSARSALHAR